MALVCGHDVVLFLVEIRSSVSIFVVVLFREVVWIFVVYKKCYIRQFVLVHML